MDRLAPMMFERIEEAFGAAQQQLFESLLQPLMFAAGLGQFLEDGYAATGWLIVGLAQVALLLMVIGPLQRLWPVEPVSDRRAVATDVIYTLVHRLGLFRVALFFTVEPLFDELFGLARVAGWNTWHLDQVWPGVTDLAWVSFLIYLVVFDFVDYWIHRAQHGWRWWWSLHALHHSQRQMTMWSDNRNHLLDDLLRDTVFVLVGQLVGVGPGQFIALVALTQLSESLQHANLRWWFGPLGERLWVSPRFHRLHHSIAIPDRNFGVLLPWWDLAFGTGNFERRYEPTGIRDQVEQGRDYGGGFWSQQWLGLKRLFGKA